MIPPDGYYSRFDSSRNWDEVLFRSGRVVQGAELNEMQEIAAHRVRGIADALFRDGAIVRDAAVVVAPDTGAVIAESGALYLRGAVRGVPPAAFTIATVGTVTIGVYLRDVVVTEQTDPLLYDPAITTQNSQEPGAARLRVDTEWGFAGDGKSGDFYPVYQVVNGVLIQKEAPPAVDAVSLAIASYDMQSAGGYYVSSGLRLTQLDDLGSGQQVYSLEEGIARIGGREVRLAHSMRLVYAAVADVAAVVSEGHAAIGGTERVPLNHTPLDSLQQVLIVAEKTVTLTHGGYSGVADALPDTSVISILSVTQGGTTYTAGSDYTLTADKVDWSPLGAEVAVGSLYTVTYRYLKPVTPTGVDSTGFLVTGAVPGTLIQVSYKYRLPRYDRLCLDATGTPTWVAGVASATNPLIPSVPTGMLGIASVYQSWDANRRIVSDAVRVIPMDQLEAMATRIDTLFGLVAILNLQLAVALNEPAAKKGVFADAFRDNSLRDAGIAQTAAIVGGELMLPIDAEILAPSSSTRVTLSYTPEVILEQVKASGSMLINPYQAFAPIPAVVTLQPEVDFWTRVDTVWTADTSRFIETGHFVPGVSRVVSSSVTAVEEALVSSSTTAVEFLRQIVIAFTVRGFDPGEALTVVMFDGINVTPAGRVADSAGVVTGSFTIPPNIPSGSKKVSFRGAQGSYGEGTFTGRGQITTEVRRRVVTIEEFHVDPLAQTFTLSAGRHVVAADAWFTAKGGNAPVYVQIRGVANGMPTSEVVAQGIIPASAIVLGGGPTTATFDPVWLDAAREYALVYLTDDAGHALAVAQLGKNDPDHGWITEQPYQIGVLLSSSNASTWTPHQDKDLKFRLYAARFSTQATTVSLGTVSAANVSDMVAAATVELPAAECNVEFVFTSQTDGSTIRMAPGQVVSLAQKVTGTYAVSAVLRGSATRSPVLYPGVQSILGKLVESAAYVSRSMPAGSNVRVAVTVQTWLPGTSSITVQLGKDDGSYVTVPMTAAAPVGDGWEERTYALPSFSSTNMRLKLTLSGSALHRPRARKLRAVIT